MPLNNKFEPLADTLEKQEEEDDETESEKETEGSSSYIAPKKLKKVNRGHRSRDSSVSKESLADFHRRLDNLIDKETNDVEKELQSFINVASLLPEQLLAVELEIEGIKMKALLDTGADNNLMKSSVSKETGLKIDSNKTITIRGVGEKNSRTIGRARASCKYYNVEAGNISFDIVEDEIISCPVILSKKFCDDQNLVINIAKRKISRVNNDDSKLTVYLNPNDEKASKVINENVKVYAAEKTLLHSGLNSVPVSINFCQTVQQDSNLYFDGNCKSSRFEGLDGVMSEHSEDNLVFLKSKPGEKNVRVRRGDLLGTVSTLVELDAEEEETEESWTLEELQKALDIGECDDEKKTEIYKMIFNTRYALSKGDLDIGKAKVTPHKIELTDHTPIWQKPRRFADPINAEISKQCEELELLDIIEKCDSPWSSPVVPVRKADGALRLCVDYRKVNKVTKQENFPMPNLSDAIYSAHNVKFFTKLDLVKGYYQVSIHTDSRKFTSFSTHRQQYQSKRLSFRLRNSGLQFQKNMQEILADFRNKRIIVYLDDILICLSRLTST